MDTRYEDICIQEWNKSWWVKILTRNGYVRLCELETVVVDDTIHGDNSDEEETVSNPKVVEVEDEDLGDVLEVGD